MIRLLLIWVMSLIVLVVLLGAACGTADFDDSWFDDDLDDRSAQ